MLRCVCARMCVPAHMGACVGACVQARLCISLRVHACVCACVHQCCVCVCVCLRARARVIQCVRACMRSACVNTCVRKCGTTWTIGQVNGSTICRSTLWIIFEKICGGIALKNRT